MHPKEAVIVQLLLLVLALCRCGDGAPRRNSSRGKSTNFNSSTMSQTTPIEVPSDDDDDKSNDWSSIVTRPTMTQTMVGGGYVVQGSSNYNYQLYDPTIPTNNNNNMFSISNYPPTKTQNFSNGTPSMSSKAKTRQIARVADRTNSLNSNINTPPNVSQNANIGRNNAGSAFHRYNATSTGETNTSNLASNNNRPSGPQKHNSAFRFYKNHNCHLEETELERRVPDSDLKNGLGFFCTLL